MFSLILIGLLTSLCHSQSDGLNVSVKTIPAGPPFEAASLVYFKCHVNEGSPLYYTYIWITSCNATKDINTISSVFRQYFGPLTTTPKFCNDMIKCTARHILTGQSGSGEIVLSPIVGVQIQLYLKNRPLYFIVNNGTAVILNQTGQFHELVCNTGLKKPSVGYWILPNGNKLTKSNEMFQVEKGGGITRPAYMTLSLMSGQGVTTKEYMGIYSCIMPDLNGVEQESHVWIMDTERFELPRYLNHSTYTGHPLMLSCMFTDSPGEFDWQVDGVSLKYNKSFSIVNRHVSVSPPIYVSTLTIHERTAIASSKFYVCLMTGQRIYSLPNPRGGLFRAKHYFILKNIGKKFSGHCTFRSNVTNISFYFENVLLDNAVDNIYNFSILIKDTTHDKHFSCVGYTDDNKVYYINFSIVALVPSHALTMDINKQPDTIMAGDNMTLDLSAVKTTGFVNSPSIVCTNASGVPLTDINGVEVLNELVHHGTTSNLKIRLNQFNLSQAGTYFCTAILNTQALPYPLTHNTSTAVKIKIPIPSVTIDLTSNNNVISNGDSVQFTCNIIINKPGYVDVPIHPVINWKIQNRTVSSEDHRVTVTYNDTTFQSILIITPVIKEYDNGPVICIAFLAPNENKEFVLQSRVAEKSMMLQIEGQKRSYSQHIQLNLVGLPMNCNKWVKVSRTNLTSNATTQQLVNTIINTCQCSDYTERHIMDERFICSINDSFAVTYRAMLYFSRQCSIDKLLGCIQDWVTSGPKIDRLAINPDCNLTISTFNDSLCSTYTIQSPKRPSSQVFLMVAGGICCAILFGIIVFVCCCVCCLLRRRKRSQHHINKQNQLEMTEENFVQRIAEENPSYGHRGIIAHYDHLSQPEYEYEYDYIKVDHTYY